MVADENKRLIGQQFLEALRSRDWNLLRSILKTTTSGLCPEQA